ncbi:Uncharacterised protein [Mycobacteroides abscessus subsp. massiliense]|nr:Uncharacterised protein [Mycobacteroides abscessus subsp. massiliense]
MLKPVAGQLVDVPEDRNEFVGVLREDTDGRGESGGDADELVRVVVKGLLVGTHRGQPGVHECR